MGHLFSNGKGSRAGLGTEAETGDSSSRGTLLVGADRRWRVMSSFREASAIWRFYRRDLSSNDGLRTNVFGEIAKD